MITDTAEPIRRIPWPVVDPHDPDAMVTREWLVTNGLGGYASGTVAGSNRRSNSGIRTLEWRGGSGVESPSRMHSYPIRRSIRGSIRARLTSSPAS